MHDKKNMHLHQTTMQSSLWFPLTVYVSLTDSATSSSSTSPPLGSSCIIYCSTIPRQDEHGLMAADAPLTGYESKVHDANVDRSRPLSQVNTRVSGVCLVYRKRCSVQVSRFAQGSREQGGTLTEDVQMRSSKRAVNKTAQEVWSGPTR